MEPWIKGQKSYPGPSNNSARERSMGQARSIPDSNPVIGQNTLRLCAYLCKSSLTGLPEYFNLVHSFTAELLKIWNDNHYINQPDHGGIT